MIDRHTSEAEMHDIMDCVHAHDGLVRRLKIAKITDYRRRMHYNSAWLRRSHGSLPYLYHLQVYDDGHVLASRKFVSEHDLAEYEINHYAALEHFDYTVTNLITGIKE